MFNYYFLMFLEVNSPAKMCMKHDVFGICNSQDQPTLPFVICDCSNSKRGEICNWIFVICNQGIIQSEDQTYWKLLHSIEIHLMKLSRKKPTPVQYYLGFLNNSEKNTSCRPPLESEACLFEIEQCTTHCTVWVQVECKAWNDKGVREGLIKI